MISSAARILCTKGRCFVFTSLIQCPQSELYRMRIENIDWNNRVIFNPNSKTKKGRRYIPMSDRVVNILLVRCAERKEGWVFPSHQKGKHITRGLVNKQWVKARKKAGLPENLVLYCARHDFGTYVLHATV